MRIKVLTRYPWSLGYGGAEIQAQKYVEYVKKSGYDISFIDDYSKNKDYDILHIVGMDYETYQIINLALSKDIKVILSPVFYINNNKAFVASKLLSILRTKHVSYNLYRLALDLAQVVSPNSNAEAQQLYEIFGINKTKCKIIYNGIDRINNINNIKPDLFVNKFNVSYDEYILCVSMIDKRKNILNLIDGYLESGVNNKLILIGGNRCDDLSYVRTVMDRIERNKKKILYIPFIEDRNLIYSAYSGARVHVMPSFYETPGLSNLEAASFGCNIVVGDCEPIREY